MLAGRVPVRRERRRDVRRRPGAPSWQPAADCTVAGQTCIASLSACGACNPGAVECHDQAVVTCDTSGQSWQTTETCDATKGFACRSGSCVQLCERGVAEAVERRLRVLGRRSRQRRRLPDAQRGGAAVRDRRLERAARRPRARDVDQDDRRPGDPSHQTSVVAQATIAPHNLEVFKLGPREVDGSADGTFNTGTDTALTRHAYKLTSDFPIVAYQFNPLDNVNVFSNDASRSSPGRALNSGVGLAYVVPAGRRPSRSRPTRRRTSAPTCAPSSRSSARATTRTSTCSRRRSVIPGGPFAQGLAQGAGADVTLQAFDVLNLETGDFNADFTGSLIERRPAGRRLPGQRGVGRAHVHDARRPLLLRRSPRAAGSPLRTVGKSYVLAQMPNRTSAVIAAGGNIGDDRRARVLPRRRGLDGDHARHDDAAGARRHVRPRRAGRVLHHPVEERLHARGEPAGDGAPGAGQPGRRRRAARAARRRPEPDDPHARSSSGAATTSSRRRTSTSSTSSSSSRRATRTCTSTAWRSTRRTATSRPSDGLTTEERGSPTPPYWTYRCQLCFPIIDPTQQPPNNVTPGKQNDGVHHIQADFPVGVIGVRLRLVRELRVRGRHPARGHQPPVRGLTAPAAGRRASRRGAAPATSGPTDARRARTRRP